MTMRLICLAPVALLAACHGGPGSGHGQGNDVNVPGDAGDKQPYAGIAANDVVRIVGTEPFWGGDIRGDTLTWTTPDNGDGQGGGQAIPVTRFAGRGGISFTGTLDGQNFTLMLTEAKCSDGMSDRTYPFVATVAIGTAPELGGCGWTDSRPFTGGE